MSRLPVRWRLTLAFACVMAILLAATGLFVRHRLVANLDNALGASLRSVWNSLQSSLRWRAECFQSTCRRSWPGT